MITLQTQTHHASIVTVSLSYCRATPYRHALVLCNIKQNNIEICPHKTSVTSHLIHVDRSTYHSKRQHHSEISNKSRI